MSLRRVVLVAALSSACVSERYAYRYRLVEPIAAEDGTEIRFSVTDQSVAFDLRNGGREPVQIVWDDSSIVLDGNAQRVFHEGVKYISRMEHQPPTTVPPGARVSDAATPVASASFWSGEGWVVKPLFPTLVFDGPHKDDVRREILGNVGREVSLFLAVDRGGRRTNYNARFRVIAAEKTAR